MELTRELEINGARLKDNYTLTFFHLLRDTEVGNLDSTLVVDQYIGTFDVAVNDVAIVGGS